MPASDIYQVTLKATYFGQEIANIFHYVQTAGSDNADNLGDDFVATILERIKDNTSEDLQFYQLDVKNLMSPSDFHSRALNETGDLAGESMPSFVTWSLTLLTNRSDSKSGGKRFAGVRELDVVNGLISPSRLLTMASLVVRIGQNLTSPDGTWRPGVYGKRTDIIGTFLNVLSGVNFFGVTTQRSRIFYK